jgi:REP element-mobilizing transposase RayT
MPINLCRGRLCVGIDGSFFRMVHMTYARKRLVSLRDTQFYHVVARCVRRAFLWGHDEYSGRDYSHRKVWVLQRLSQLAAIFAIDICAYAVMSNHYHLVLHVDAERVRTWTQAEVVTRWTGLFRAPAVIERWCAGQADAAETQVAVSIIEGWRTRLYDISWFMRCLNQHLAQRANAEDGCTGRFWQGRFSSQALLDEAGLLTAMAYVDLNPVRAGMATSAEDSQFTSIRQRILELRDCSASVSSSRVPLLAFRATQATEAATSATTLACSFSDYRAVLTWTAGIVSGAKQEVHEGTPALIREQGIEASAWALAMRPRGNLFGRAIGRLNALRLHAKTLGQRWVRGLRESDRLYCG